MKLVIIGIIITAIVAGVAFFAGYKFCEKDKNFDVAILQEDHCVLAEKLNSIDRKIDNMGNGIERIECMLRKNLNGSPYLLDK